MEFGVGLWTGQSTALVPRHHVDSYRQILDDAMRAEALGFDSFWMSEHHFYYDGYCPSLLTVAGAVLENTTSLRFGTGVLLLPYQSAERVGSAITALTNRHGPRLDLGVSIGYRDIEFDGKAINRKTRLRRHLAAVEHLTTTVDRSAFELWMGVQAEKSVYRAGTLGANLFLPGSMSVDHIRDLVGHLHRGWEDAGRQGTRPRVGALRNFWIADSAAEKEAALDWVKSSYVLYQGLGYSVAATENAGSIDFKASFAEASKGVVATSIVGTVDEVTAELAALEQAGVDRTVLRMTLEGAPPSAVHQTMERFSRDVLPHLSTAVAS